MLFKLAHLAFVASLLTSTLAAPAPVPQSGSDGSAYQCPASANVPARKSSLQSMGATDQDLAITILETSCNMNSNYPYGDVEPASAGGGPKTGDAANFGLFKNNWLQIRTYCSQFAGQGPNDWKNGAALNSDDAAAINCQHEQQQKIPGGIGAWWGAQRGCSNGQDYEVAVNYVKGYLDQGHLSDDWVTYYNLANC